MPDAASRRSAVGGSARTSDTTLPWSVACAFCSDSRAMPTPRAASAIAARACGDFIAAGNRVPAGLDDVGFEQALAARLTPWAVADPLATA